MKYYGGDCELKKKFILFVLTYHVTFRNVSARVQG